MACPGVSSGRQRRPARGQHLHYSNVLRVTVPYPRAIVRRRHLRFAPGPVPGGGGTTPSADDRPALGHRRVRRLAPVAKPASRRARGPPAGRRLTLRGHFIFRQHASKRAELGATTGCIPRLSDGTAATLAVPHRALQRPSDVASRRPGGRSSARARAAPASAWPRWSSSCGRRADSGPRVWIGRRCCRFFAISAPSGVSWASALVGAAAGYLPRSPLPGMLPRRTRSITTTLSPFSGTYTPATTPLPR